MRRSGRLGAWLAALAVTTVLATGCSILAPQPDRSQFYTLVPTLAQAPAVSAPGGESGSDALSGRVVAIGPVQLPGYLDRHEIATRISPTRIHYSPLDLWAEPLSQNMTRVLQADVAALLGSTRVVAWPWLGPVDYQVVVTVLRFEPGTPAGANLEAHWTIRSGVGGDVLASGDTSIARPIEGKGAAADVAGLSDALSELAQQLGAALRKTASGTTASQGGG